MTTGLDVFDKAIDKANVWLKELMRLLGLEDRRHAYSGLRAVLHALRDRLPAKEAINLGAQLPLVLRGLYYEDWNASKNPRSCRSRGEFLRCVEEGLGRARIGVDTELLARAVFQVLATHVNEGEIEAVRQAFPREIRRLIHHTGRPNHPSADDLPEWYEREQREKFLG